MRFSYYFVGASFRSFLPEAKPLSYRTQRVVLVLVETKFVIFGYPPQIKLFANVEFTGGGCCLNTPQNRTWVRSPCSLSSSRRRSLNTLFLVTFCFCFSLCRLFVLLFFVSLGGRSRTGGFARPPAVAASARGTWPASSTRTGRRSRWVSRQQLFRKKVNTLLCLIIYSSIGWLSNV